MAKRTERRQICIEVDIEFSREDDGRWIAEAVPDNPLVPWTAAYGATREEAIRNATAIIYEGILGGIRDGSLQGEPVDVHFREAA